MIIFYFFRMKSACLLGWAFLGVFLILKWDCEFLLFKEGKNWGNKNIVGFFYPYLKVVLMTFNLIKKLIRFGFLSALTLDGKNKKPLITFAYIHP